MNKIYFDNAATTTIDPASLQAMVAVMESNLGNPSSIHSLGVQSNIKVELARRIIANILMAQPEEIYFTSGGTESNNLAIIGTALANKDKGNHLLVSAIEHPSVLEAAQWLAENGFEVELIPVDNKGFVKTSMLRSLIRPSTILVSVMHANNEVGSIQDIPEIGRICREYQIPLHVDACQSFTKIPINVEQDGIGLLTLSSHKIHGPRGVAALYKSHSVQMRPISFGGGHESGLRSGTLFVEGIVGLAKASEVSASVDLGHTRDLKNKLFQELQKRFRDIELNGCLTHSLPNILNLYIPQIESKKLLHYLDKHHVIVSAGSACSAGKKSPSHVLQAMGHNKERASETLRISLSRWSTQKEVADCLDILGQGILTLRGAALDHAN